MRGNYKSPSELLQAQRETGKSYWDLIGKPLNPNTGYNLNNPHAAEESEYNKWYNGSKLSDEDSEKLQQFLEEYDKDVKSNSNSLPSYKGGKDKFTTFVERMGPKVYRQLHKQGIYNPYIYDNMMRQLAWESNYGTSPLAISNHNYGGVKSSNTEYAKYKDDDAFADYYVSLIRRKYPQAIKAKDTKSYAKELKKVGYYEDSLQNYSQKLSNMSSVSRAAKLHMHTNPKQYEVEVLLDDLKNQAVQQPVSTRVEPPINKEPINKEPFVNTPISTEAPLITRPEYLESNSLIKKSFEQNMNNMLQGKEFQFKLPGFRGGKDGNQPSTYYAGTLPEVTAQAYAPIRLNTYYPVVSDYPYTGHSELKIPIDRTTWWDYTGEKEYPNDRVLPYVTIDKKSGAPDYNLVTNNCADATLNYLNKAFNTHESPMLFTTPGDVRDYAIHKLHGKLVHNDNGSDTVLIPRNARNKTKISKEALDLYSNSPKRTTRIGYHSRFKNGKDSGIKEYASNEDMHINPDGSITTRNGNTGSVILPDVNVYAQKDYNSAFDYSGANNVMGTIADFTPVVGDIKQGLEAANDLRKGNYKEAAIGAGLLLLPNVLEKPLKYAGKTFKRLLGDVKSKLSKHEVNIQEITDSQWDKAYTKAVQKGDMDEVQRLRDLHFKAKAPNTKITDSVWHGSRAKNFNTFDLKYFGRTDGGVNGYGHYFGTKRHATGYKNPREFYLNMENPYTGNHAQFFNREEYFKDNELYGRIPRKADAMRYKKGMEQYKQEFLDKDGVIDTDPLWGDLGTVYLVPKSNQIKLADAITYDDANNIIPLSNRDNFKLNDIRWAGSIKEHYTSSGHGLLDYLKNDRINAFLEGKPFYERNLGPLGTRRESFPSDWTLTKVPFSNESKEIINNSAKPRILAQAEKDIRDVYDPAIDGPDIEKYVKKELSYIEKQLDAKINEGYELGSDALFKAHDEGKTATRTGGLQLTNNGKIVLREGEDPEKFAVHEWEHRRTNSNIGGAHYGNEKRLLRKAFTKEFRELSETVPDFKGMNMDDEMVTTVSDTREALIGKTHLRKTASDLQNKMIDKCSDEKVFKALEKANAYGAFYIKKMRELGKLTPELAQNIREALKHVGSYVAPTGIGLGVLSTIHAANKKALEGARQ